MFTIYSYLVRLEQSLDSTGLFFDIKLLVLISKTVKAKVSILLEKNSFICLILRLDYSKK